MSVLDPSIAQKLKQAAGPSGWSEDPAEIAPHLREWRGRWTGNAPILLMPVETEQVARILSVCDETGTAIVPQGGNTGLVGGQIPTSGEVLLSLERMNRIRSVSLEDNTLIAEAGVVLANAQHAADEAGRLFPLSLAAEGSCTIGGNVSTNAGGVNVLRYGMTRELVLGLEVVLADGRVLDLLRGLRKDNTGYDLKQLFIGAEGTLGIVTAAMLRLFPKPAGYTTVLVAISDVDVAVELLNRLQEATGGLVTAFEIMQRRARALEEGKIVHAVFAKTARDRESLWRLRETIPEAQKLDGASIANDISVPLSSIPEFIRSAEKAVQAVLPEARAFTFGHVGDGNLHFAVQAPGHDAALLAAREAIERAVYEETAKF